MAIKSKKEKLTPRQRCKLRIRKIISGTNERPRVSVFKSSKYTYAQIISDTDGKTLLSASTRDKDVMQGVDKFESDVVINSSKSSKSIRAAFNLGQVLAKKAKEKNINNIVFDRNGYVYTGRVKALAEGLRAGGMQI